MKAHLTQRVPGRSSSWRPQATTLPFEAKLKARSGGVSLLNPHAVLKQRRGDTTSSPKMGNDTQISAGIFTVRKRQWH